MYRKLSSAGVVLVLALGLLGCDGRRPPMGPSPVPQAGPPAVPPAAMSPVRFSEPGTGFSTTDLHDAEGHIVQFSTPTELIWTADGSRLSGYWVETRAYPGVSFIVGNSCAEGCALEVRFGSQDGERRAYLTADYGHDNPGTLVSLAVVDGVLRATRTNTFPPGTPTLSGVISEMTATGSMPVEGVDVYRGVVSGWRGGKTDKNGFFRIPGLINGTEAVEIRKDGYQNERRTVTMDGDTRLDVVLVRH